MDKIKALNIPATKQDIEEIREDLGVLAERIVSVLAFKKVSNFDVIEDTGHSLRCLRVIAGISQKNLARKLSVSSNYLSLLEAGKRDPSMKFLREFLKVVKK